MGRVKWPPIVERAAAIVLSYEGSVTLRQLFYRLVSEQLIPNTESAYKTLSDRTAKARRSGTFPDLEDRTRRIIRPLRYDNPKDALDLASELYRRDRTEGQEYAVYIGVEKHALEGLLSDWFEDRGLPVLALGGYSSQTFADDVRRDIARDERQAILLYGGDFDPSGEDIDRDYVERVGVFDEVVRVALTREQVAAFDLPPMMGKATDSRASAFFGRHGELIQVELDALPPPTLHQLYEDSLADYWDTDAFEDVSTTERAEQKALAAYVDAFTEEASDA